MGSPLLMTCRAPYATCASRRAARAKPKTRTRLAKVAIAMMALYVMFIGERWVLEDSPTAANELIVATCAVDMVFGSPAATNACASTEKSE